MNAQNWNTDWQFEAVQTGRSYPVTLPHDGMIHTDRDPSIRNYFLSAGFLGETYQYTKRFFAPAQWRGKTVLVELESVYCNTTVALNGKQLADHPYGFTPIVVDLTDQLRFGEHNLLTVTADVPREGHNRWYTGGGIYRPVNLFVADKRHIDLYGLKITTLSIHPARIRVDVHHTGGEKIHVAIFDGGQLIAEVSGQAPFEINVPDAKLWSAETPHLYQARAELIAQGSVVDTAEETFGIRTVTVQPEKRLLVNGVPTFLRGGCIHNDNGVIGVINNDVTELRRAWNIKRAGFNAIRSAHHPMSRSLMKACDEVGLYVMDEAFDSWYRPKVMNPYVKRFMDSYLSDTRLMVQDAYNHPSVIMYSIGNEIPEAGGVKGVRIGKSIISAIREMDDTRLITFCPSVHWLREYVDGTPYLTVDEDEWMTQSEENRQADWKHYLGVFMGAAANIPDSEKNEPYPPTYIRMDEEATKHLYPALDVAGYNYYEDKYETLHALHPERVLLGTETRGDRIVDTMRFAKEHPYLIGDFIWTLQDHLGECNTCNERYGKLPEDDRPKNLRGKDYPWLLNHGGVVDLLGKPLPAIHRYELAWGGHGLWLAAQVPIHDGVVPTYTSYLWTDTIESWSFDGCEGKPTWIDVYTDAAEAEVFVNGSSLGRTPVVDFFAKFPAAYEAGEVLAVGYDADGHELYRNTLSTASSETILTAVPNKKKLIADGEDFSFIDIAVTDRQGIVKAWPERVVSIQVDGAGTLAGFGSANPVNAERFDQNHHTTYQGRLQAVIRSARTAGNVRVMLSAEGLEPVTITIPVKEAAHE